MYLQKKNPILTYKQLMNLKEHKYGVRSKSVLDPILRKWRKWLVKQVVPSWLSPNLITIIGLIVNIVTSLTLLYYSPDCQQEVPGWACFMCALGLFVYQSLDAIVGKKARRTNSSTPLNELFDHGCDSISTVFVSLAVCVSVQLGSAPKLMFLQSFFAFALFYWAQWQTYVSGTWGTLKFGCIDVKVAQTGIIIIHMVSGCFGCSFWTKSFFSETNVPRYLLYVAVAMYAAVRTLFWSSQTILFKGAGKNGSSIARTSVISPIIPFSLVLFPSVMLAGSADENGVYASHPAMYIMTFGLIAAKVTNRLVVAHMTKGEMDFFDTSFRGPSVMFVNQFFNTPVPQSILLFLSLLWVCIDLWLYCSRVCIEICDSMDIHLFRVTPPSMSSKSPRSQKAGKERSSRM